VTNISSIKAKLPEGMRLVTGGETAGIAYVGIAVKAGTRDEYDDESGMAHFLEHLSFKGTEKRTATRIIQRMESVGGELNAFTGKEETIFYCACERQYVGRAVELLLDIVFHSTYPEEEMRHEVEVVVDEIESYNDSPAELIYDDFEALLFEGKPLGRSILGKADALRGYRTEDVKAFADRMYKPENSLLFVYGA
jgi:predicted Zn-dependent peptidase